MSILVAVSTSCIVSDLAPHLSVTSVGATTGISPESGVDFSSGGFSNIFPRPSFQDSAVPTFLTQLGSTYSGRYNASGRGFPDVSMQGTNFIVNVAGTLFLIGGTSASSPTFASLVALVNDQLLNAGRSTLGWLNPLLYSSAASSVFNDITSGNNPGCGTNGFTAVTGWDPVCIRSVVLSSKCNDPDSYLCTDHRPGHCGL